MKLRIHGSKAFKLEHDESGHYVRHKESDSRRLIARTLERPNRWRHSCNGDSCIVETVPAPAPSRAADVDELAGDEIEDLTGLSIAKAKPIIAACDDPATLTRWADADSRAGIGEAIDARLAELPDGDDGDE